MRVLILSCNTGAGHNSCARAIQQSFLNCGASCDIEDSLQFCSGRLSKFMSWGHTTMYRHIPGLFRHGYGYAEKHPGLLREDAAVYKLLTSGTEALNKCIRKHNYDTVICTHVFSGLLLREMLLKFPVKLKTAFVATDYTCSPGTAKSNLDLYFIPSESLREEFIAQGVPPERLMVTGIPVQRDFYIRGDIDFAKQHIGIDPTHFHLLLMCGSMGCGPIEELTEQLHRYMGSDCELTVVCGTNEKLYERLQEAYSQEPNIHICGFIDQISVLMDSADLYLTKPGGLSTSEALAKGLPMVLVDAVAGCEEHNLSFFLNCGGAVTADEVSELAQLCVRLSGQPEKLQRMKAALTSVHTGNAANMITEAMRRLYTDPQK